MPYITVRGNINAHPNPEAPFIVYLSGLKRNDLASLLLNFDSVGTAGPLDNSIRFQKYHPTTILSALEVFGYRVVSSTVYVEQHPITIWTMHKEFPIPEPDTADPIIE